MTEKSTKLLKALQKAARSENTDILAAEQVNQIGAKLGAPPENVIHWIAEWQNEGVVHVEWDGKLKLRSHKSNPTNQKNALERVADWVTSFITIAFNIPKLMIIVAVILTVIGAIAKYFGLLK